MSSNEEFNKDFNSAKNTFSQIQHIIESHIKGDLISLENDESDLAKIFDMYSGVDALQKYSGQIRPIALRTQWGVNYQTFTIRYKRHNGQKTEYEKRIDAIYSNLGYIYPYLTIQTYVKSKEDPKILSCGIIKTKDLYDFIIENFERITQRDTSNATFLVIPFKEVKLSTANMILF